MNSLFRFALLVLSLLMGIAEFYTIRIGWHPSSYDWNHQILTDISDVPMIFILGAATAVILYILTKAVSKVPLIPWKPGAEGKVTDAPFAVLSLFLFLSWLPFFIVFFPGTGMNDTTDIMRAGIWAAGQHTFVYCMFIYGLGQAGQELAGNAAYGIAAASLIQMALFSVTISYVLSWLYQKTGRMWLSFILALYYGFTPMIVNMSFSNVKDVLFSAVILLWIPILCEFFMKPAEEAWKENSRLFIVGSLGMMLLRNNGWYVYVVLLGLMVLAGKPIRSKIAIKGLILVFICMIPNTVLKETMDLPQLFQERVGIPIEQLGRTVKMNRPLDEKETAYVDRIMIPGTMAEDYDPFTADNIKWNSNFDFYYFNAHPDDFMETWKSVGKKYPKDYMEAWMLATYGYWAFPAPDEMTQSRFTWAFSTDEMTSGMNPIHNNDYRTATIKKAFSDDTMETMGRYLWKHSRYLGGGTCLWILLVIGLILLRRGQYKRLMVIAPGVLLWGTLMVATPAAFVFRYVYYFPLCMPFYILLPFLPEGRYGITRWKNTMDIVGPESRFPDDSTKEDSGWTHWADDTVRHVPLGTMRWKDDGDDW